MSELVVNNPNILVDSSATAIGGRRPHCSGRTNTERDMALLRQVRQIRREIEETVCSATWAEDCLSEEFIRLRNDRPRFGSVFIGRSSGQSGRETFNRAGAASGGNS